MVRKKQKKQHHMTPQEAIDREWQKKLDLEETIANFKVEDSPPADLFEVVLPVADLALNVESKISSDTKVEPVATGETLLLTVPEVCMLLNVSRSTVSRMEKSGSLPGRLLLGGSVRYHRDSITNWLYDQVKAP